MKVIGIEKTKDNKYRVHVGNETDVLGCSYVGTFVTDDISKLNLNDTYEPIIGTYQGKMYIKGAKPLNIKS